jgi:hypothetical protein
VTGPGPRSPRDDRRHFLRCRRRVLAASGVTVGALAVLAALFLAPNRLASLRLGEVALGWWVAVGVAATGLVALSRGVRDPHPVDVLAGTSRLTPLAIAVVWGSPALWLGLPPLLLADGIRGLWPAAVVVGGAIVALLLLGTPWTRSGSLLATASVVARSRWPEARGCRALLGAIEVVVAGLFVWAQLAAAREIGVVAGWPRATTIGVTLLVLVAVLLPDLPRVRLTALGGGLALVGLAAPLVVIALETTAAWPFVWSTVASRSRIAFGEGTSWTREGDAVQGPAAISTLRFADEQRVAFGGRGSVIVESRHGGRLARDVETGEEVAVHPGDRLVIPPGLRIRFQPGRRVPDAPDSGPEWVEPPSRDASWLGLVALGVTGLLGALGLPSGGAPLNPGGTGGLSAGRGARLAGALVTSGMALVVAWSLYAAWLVPEIYVGGVAGAEVYALPTSMPGAKASEHRLAWLAFGGLAAGGAAAAVGGLRGLLDLGGKGGAGWPRRLALVLVGGAAILTWLAPVAAWVILIAALALAASALAPTAVLACWSERATARGAAAGTTVALAAFLLVAIGGVASPAVLAGGWGSAIVAAPAAVAAPVHFLVAWLLRSRRPPSARAPLPPGFEVGPVLLPERPTG